MSGTITFAALAELEARAYGPGGGRESSLALREEIENLLIGPESPVSASYLADALGESEERVRVLAARGILPRDGFGLFPIQAAVDAYVAHLRNVEVEQEQERRRRKSTDAANKRWAEEVAKQASDQDEREALAELLARDPGLSGEGLRRKGRLVLAGVAEAVRFAVEVKRGKAADHRTVFRHIREWLPDDLLREAGLA